MQAVNFNSLLTNKQSNTGRVGINSSFSQIFWPKISEKGMERWNESSYSQDLYKTRFNYNQKRVRVTSTVKDEQLHKLIDSLHFCIHRDRKSWMQ